MNLEELFDFRENDFIPDTPQLVNKMKSLHINEVKFINDLNRIQEPNIKLDLQLVLEEKENKIPTLPSTQSSHLLNHISTNTKLSSICQIIKRSKVDNKTKGRFKKRTVISNCPRLHKMDQSQDQIIIDDTQSMDISQELSRESQLNCKRLKHNFKQTYVQLQNGRIVKAISQEKVNNLEINNIQQKGNRQEKVQLQKDVINKNRLILQNKFIYNGQLFLNKFHGKGQLLLPQKQLIQAKWLQGKPINPVLIKYPYGQIYYGQINKYHRHGHGYLFFNDGSKYQGDFIDGQLTGYGVFTDSLSQKTQGYWIYGHYLGIIQQEFQDKLREKSQRKKKKHLNRNTQIFNKTETNQFVRLTARIQ